jgi:hypothetical protein
MRGRARDPIPRAGRASQDRAMQKAVAAGHAARTATRTHAPRPMVELRTNWAVTEPSSLPKKKTPSLEMLRWACVLCLAASLVGAAAQVPAKARAAPAAACSWLTLPVLCACAAVALGFRAHAMPKQRIQVLCAVRVPAMLLRSSPCRTRDAQRTDSSASAPSGTAVASAAGMVPPARPWPR